MVKVKIHRASTPQHDRVAVSINGGSKVSCENNLIICVREGDYLYFGKGEVNSFEQLY